MLRDAYEYMVQHGGKPGGWSTLLRPCPRIGDLRVLNGLALRGLMTDGDHDDRPHRVEVWPKWIRITAAGAREWERLNDALNGHLEHTCSRSARVPPTGSST